MNDVVFDASALLAVLQGEPGSERWKDAVVGATISAVNLSEVATKLLEGGMPAPQVRAVLEPLNLDIVEFDTAQAFMAAELREQTKHLGLSLGDRACLALTKMRHARALTTERAWQSAAVGVRVVFLR